MISGAMLSLAPSGTREDEKAEAETYAPEVIQLAAQVRGLRKADKKVVVFASVGSNVVAGGLVDQIASSLHSSEMASVIVLSLHPDGAASSKSKSLPDPVRTAVEPQHANHTGLRQVQPHVSGVHRLNLLDLRARKDVTLADILAQLRSQSDYVLIDAPEMLHSAVTPLAVEAADSVVLLVQEGASSLRGIGETRRQLLAMKASVAGFVFLKQPRKARQEPA